MRAFPLHILASERVFFEGECLSLRFPATDGFYGIQAGHANLLASLVPGVLTFLPVGGEEEVCAVSEGLIKVEDGEVLILADSVEYAREIDEARARKAMEEAREKLLLENSQREYRQAEARLSRALSRLKAKSDAGFPNN